MSTAKKTPVKTLIFLFSLPLLILLIGVIRRFFDASMQERISRYLASPEGRNMARVYILLVITAVVVTFPKQIRVILNLIQNLYKYLYSKHGPRIRSGVTKFLQFVLKKASALKGAVGGLARATSERRGLRKLKTPSLRGFFRRRGLLKRIHRKHRRKTV